MRNELIADCNRIAKGFQPRLVERTGLIIFFVVLANVVAAAPPLALLCTLGSSPPPRSDFCLPAECCHREAISSHGEAPAEHWSDILIEVSLRGAPKRCSHWATLAMLPKLDYLARRHV
jgi:hypothetical protein